METEVIQIEKEKKSSNKMVLKKKEMVVTSEEKNLSNKIIRQIIEAS